MDSVEDHGVAKSAGETDAGPGGHRSDGSRHEGEPLKSTEEDLEEFMDTYEDILAAADQYERMTHTPNRTLCPLVSCCILGFQKNPS
jgi:hypothetical protein